VWPTLTQLETLTQPRFALLLGARLASVACSSTAQGVFSSVVVFSSFGAGAKVDAVLSCLPLLFGCVANAYTTWDTLAFHVFLSFFRLSLCLLLHPQTQRSTPIDDPSYQRRPLFGCVTDAYTTWLGDTQSLHTSDFFDRHHLFCSTSCLGRRVLQHQEDIDMGLKNRQRGFMVTVSLLRSCDSIVVWFIDFLFRIQTVTSSSRENVNGDDGILMSLVRASWRWSLAFSFILFQADGAAYRDLGRRYPQSYSTIYNAMNLFSKWLWGQKFMRQTHLHKHTPQSPRAVHGHALVSNQHMFMRDMCWARVLMRGILVLVIGGLHDWDNVGELGIECPPGVDLLDFDSFITFLSSFSFFLEIC
jgi:hypothetical protein